MRITNPRHNKSQSSCSLTYYLDSNAWIALGKTLFAYEALVIAHLEGRLRVRLMRQNVNELLDETRVSSENLIANRRILFPFLSQVELDRIFILDLSRLDSALISSDLASDTYVTHMTAKQESIPNRRDAIHIVNAMESGAVLVTCDSQVWKTALRVDVSIRCVAQFINELTGQEAASCLSSQC